MLFRACLLLAFWTAGVVAACTRRPAAEKPLSVVLREEGVQTPKSGPDVSGRKDAPAKPVAGEEDVFRGFPTGTTPEGRPYIGAAVPSVTVLVFTDLECPYCRLAHQKMMSWLQRWPHVRFVYHHYPLSFHPNAMYYARLTVCAARANRFWQSVETLFQRQGAGRMDAYALARIHGMDGGGLSQCAMGRDVQAFVDADIAQGNRLKIPGTPTFVVDGKTMNMVEIEKYLGTFSP